MIFGLAFDIFLVCHNNEFRVLDKLGGRESDRYALYDSEIKADIVKGLQFQPILQVISIKSPA